jgi:predicted nuclease of predicted toxin-antitoxin system
VHTLDLPDQNRTTDQQITGISVNDQRIVITKDADFVTSYLLTARRYNLLLLSTGNITNADLEALVVPAIPTIIAAFDQHSYLELSRTTLIIHS